MKRVITLFLSAGLSLTAHAAGLDCLSCHDEKGPATKASVHGSLTCTACHSTIQAYPHPENQKAQVNCAGCHANTGSDVAGSVHAHAGALPCLNCHGNAHTILASSNPKSPTYPQNLPRTCGECHGTRQGNVSEVYSKYIDSIHGFALTKDGLLVAASCSSCHGAHKILTSKDPNSRTNRAHIVDTCGTCHGGPKTAYAESIHGQMLEAGSDRGTRLHQLSYNPPDLQHARGQHSDQDRRDLRRLPQRRVLHLRRHVPCAGFRARLSANGALLGLPRISRHSSRVGCKVDRRARRI